MEETMRTPFYYNIKQPWRGLFAALLMVIVTAAIYYIGSLKFWWAGEYGKMMPWAFLPNYLLVLFAWLFIYEFYFQTWPFSKVAQPLKGLLTFIVIILMSMLQFYIMKKLGTASQWENGHMAVLSSAWTFWIFIFGPWTNMKFIQQYKGKHPLICGVSGFATTFGLAWLTVMIMPQSAITYMGGVSGVPFTWFLAAIFICFLLNNWPVEIALPWKPFALLGWFMFITVLVVCIYQPLGLSPFQTDTVGAYKASIFSVVLQAGLMIPMALFQLWPFHKLKPLQKGFLWIFLGSAIGIAAYEIVIHVIGPTQMTNPMTLTKVITWGFCLFVGIFVYFINFGGAQAPQPGSEGRTQQHAT